MGPDARRYVKIARRSAANSRFAFAAQANLLSRIGAGWDVDPDRIGPKQSAAAFASRARIAGQLAGPVATRARLAKLHGALSYRFTAGALAFRTSDWLASRLGAGAAAGFAGDRPLERDRSLKAAHGVKKIDVHARFDVLARHGLARRAPGSAEHAAEAAEKIAEIVHAEFMIATGARRTLLPLLISARLIRVETGSESGVAEFVIQLAFLLVAQDIVGDRDILELILGVLVPRIDVGMIFARELAIGFADVVVGSATGDAEDLVVIAFCHYPSKIIMPPKVSSEP